MYSPPAIYVESHIDCSIDEVWAHTQEPRIHQRWDVRFTTIDYLPRPNTDEPQQFRYATSVVPGLCVSGRGETLGERHRPDGTAYSGLRFWSDHPVSLIRNGSGYWRYVPAPGGGVRFLTRYDYTVRWGSIGRVVDRLFFRRVFGWATAWSFDRLRLWIEHDITPERSLRRSIQHAAATAALWSTAVALGLFAIGLAPASTAPVAVTLVAMAAGAAVARHTRDHRPSGRVPLRRRPTHPSISTQHQPSLQSARKSAA